MERSWPLRRMGRILIFGYGKGRGGWWSCFDVFGGYKSACCLGEGEREGSES